MTLASSFRLFVVFALAACAGGADDSSGGSVSALGAQDDGIESPVVPTGEFRCRGPQPNVFCFGQGVASDVCTDELELKIRNETHWGTPIAAATLSIPPNFTHHGSAHRVEHQISASFDDTRGRGRLIMWLSPQEGATWRGSLREVVRRDPNPTPVSLGVTITCELAPES